MTDHLLHTSISRRGLLALTASALPLGLGAAPIFANEQADTPTASAVPQDAGARNDAGEYTYTPTEELQESDLPDTGALAATDGIEVTEIKGATRYETAAQEAQRAYSSSSWVLVASGVSYADSIAAAGLAGALGCPIVLADRTSLPEASATAIKALGAKNAIILGGTNGISAAVETRIRQLTGTATRLAGSTRYKTQEAVVAFGRKHGFWTGDTAIITTGEDFSDALAVSPVSFNLKAPVLFTDRSGILPTAQKSSLAALTGIKRFLIVGGTARVSRATGTYLTQLAAQRGGSVERLSGSTRYETSAAVATYAVKNLGFRWDGAAFTSGQTPYDALAGGPLQGKNRSVLLLADGGSTASVSSVPKQSITSNIAFLGGYASVPITTRVRICTHLGLPSYANVSISSYAISLSRMAQLEASGAGANGISYSSFYGMLDPNAYSYNTTQFFQFAVLNKGYSGVTAAQMNAYVANNCIWQEQRYGRTSGLRNMGNAFINAARTYGINEAYLLAHAIWESAWGCSELASGWTANRNGVVNVNGSQHAYYKGTTYYNYYGIGAYDSNALSGGRAMAVKEGWTTREKAILGAAKWIASNYLNRASGQQNTLYLMKFDVPGAVRTGSIWHQYCTGGNAWVLGIARVMANCYAAAGKSLGDAPVTFSVPSYSGQ